MYYVLSKNKPNVLLIVSEGNGENLSCYGDPNVRTPNLDKLAAGVVRFSNAYCTQAVCSAGRSSILTGLYPHQNGQIGLSNNEYTMYGNIPNLPSLLKPQGYNTGLLNKLHVKPYDVFPWDVWWHERDYYFERRDIKTMAQKADEFIANTGDDPFFLMLAPQDCHIPFIHQYEGLPENPLDADDVTPLPFVGVDTPRIRKHTADYYNCMQRLDVLVGLLMNTLLTQGKAENTLIIFTTDHGPQFSRAKNCTCYEGGLRIPMIVNWPDRIPAGCVVDEFVSQIDLLPTIMSAVGAEIPAHIAGESILSLVSGDSTGWRNYSYGQWTAAHAPTYFPQRSIRGKRYKLIINYRSDKPNPAAQINSGTATFQERIEVSTLPEEVQSAPETVKRAYAIYEDPPSEELYDLQQDPWEFNNLTDLEYEPIKDRLRTELLEWQRKTGDLI